MGDPRATAVSALRQKKKDTIRMSLHCWLLLVDFIDNRNFDICQGEDCNRYAQNERLLRLKSTFNFFCCVYVRLLISGTVCASVLPLSFLQTTSCEVPEKEDFSGCCSE
jgi:hypothetical protein